MSPRTTTHCCASSQVSIMDQNKALQAENEELRRLLQDAQELLVQRNARLATLEGELQALMKEHGCHMIDNLEQSFDSHSSTEKNVAVSSNAENYISPPPPPIGSPSRSNDTPAFGILVHRRLMERKSKAVDAKSSGTSESFHNEKKKIDGKRLSSTTAQTDRTSTLTAVSPERHGLNESTCVDKRVLETCKQVPSLAAPSTIDTYLSSTPSKPSLASTGPSVSPNETDKVANGELKRTAQTNRTSNPTTVSPQGHVVKDTTGVDKRNEPEADCKQLPSFAASSTIDTNLSSSPSSPRVASIRPVVSPDSQKKVANAESDITEKLLPSSFVTSRPTGIPAPRRYSKKTIQPSIQRLPREEEFESTMQVINYMLVDGDSDVGVYTGSLDVKSKMPDGQGKMIYDDYRSYSGDWKDGRWHGQGHVRCKAYDYVGSFVNDQKHGWGIMTCSDGNVYEGEFEHDKRHGRGVMVYSDGSKYVGEFAHNSREGKGDFVMSNGCRYFGYFHNDSFHGQGNMTFEDGSVYFGQFKFGQKEGHGIELGANGLTRYDGLFENNEPSDDGSESDEENDETEAYDPSATEEI